MDFQNNAITDSWLEDTYTESLFNSPGIDNFDQANFVGNFNSNFNSADPTFNQWDLLKPLADEYTSPAITLSDNEDYFVRPTVPTTEAFPRKPFKRWSSPESDVEASKPKRGRPRRSCAAQSPPSSSSSKMSARTPHNVVERKYRESLNSEMERLCLAVPLTARWKTNVCATTGKPKPSKAIVLAAAINYIHDLERERDTLRMENAGYSVAQ